MVSYIMMATNLTKASPLSRVLLSWLFLYLDLVIARASEQRGYMKVSGVVDHRCRINVSGRETCP